MCYGMWDKDVNVDPINLHGEGKAPWKGLVWTSTSHISLIELRSREFGSQVNALNSLTISCSVVKPIPC